MSAFWLICMCFLQKKSAKNSPSETIRHNVAQNEFYPHFGNKNLKNFSKKAVTR